MLKFITYHIYEISKKFFMYTFPGVIVPCYNVAEYLPDCLNSLKVQTICLNHVQFIFIDDASVDSTLDILKHFEAFYLLF